MPNPTAVKSCLGEIAGKVEPRIGKMSWAGRCHKPPRTLESDFEMSTKVLGSGYAGQVKLAVRRGMKNKQQVAVKSFKLRGLKTSKKAQLLTEFGIFLCMDHPHVARLLDVYETNTDMHLVMECMEGGELFDRVTQVKRFTEYDAADATRQMLLSLHYVHSYGIVHRDLKLENFLYDIKGGNHLKMIDFGFSKFFDSRGGRLKTSCGTMAYVAPEVLSKSYNFQCDLWSMGVIVFILLSGRMPFRGKSEDQMRDIKRGKYTFKNEYWANVSSCAKEFTRSLLEINPAKRLTSKAALDHRWIVNSCRKGAPALEVSIFDALHSWELAPKFQRATHSMMAWSLTNEHHAQVRDYFLALDKNHDGFISPEELKDALMTDLSMTAGEATCALGVLSANSDQRISYSDFLAAMLYSHLPVDDDLLQSTFKNFDTDGSGFIEPDNLRDLLGESFEGEEVEDLVKDAGISGADGKVDFQEFSKYTTSRKPVASGLPSIADAARSAAAPLSLTPRGERPVWLGSGSQDLAAKALELDVDGTEGTEPVEIVWSDKRQPVCCMLM